MKLTENDIKHIAELARIELNEEEIKNYSEQMSAVLDYVEMLQEVDTEGIEETTQVTDLYNVARNDEAEECEPGIIKSILEQFPESKDGLLKVHKVFK